MPRIRSIKPESCISEPLASVSDLAALAFAYLPCFCDDEGRLSYSPRKVKAQLFPMREHVSAEDCERVIGELADAGLVRLYSAGGKGYLHVVGFAEHQHPQRPKPSELPPPPADAQADAPCEEPAVPSEPCACADDSMTGQRSVADASATGHGSGTEASQQESNRRGGEGSCKGKRRGEEAARAAEAAAVVIGRLNELTGKSFRPGTKQTLSAIGARLKEGYTVEQMLSVVEDRHRRWGRDPTMREHLCPETLFRPSKFEKYVNAAMEGGPARGGASHADYD